ncbi:bacteriophage abortive infection AbiH family protein [Roseivirga seohaensis]|uniref:bacteriophage abortive infection AbiH family protein n=1 Tax=Roseivirga seohaensis TaxID=1914963 RepID=UPI0021A57E30|nr:bacteriophage abortive infection AbiH family protein [Roseivirga seohaensis]
MGNGFDLSHKLPTSLEDFVTFLVKELFDDDLQEKSPLLDKNKAPAFRWVVSQFNSEESIDWDILVKSQFNQFNRMMTRFWSSNPDASQHTGLPILRQEKYGSYPNLLFENNHLFWRALCDTNQFRWINFERAYYKRLTELCKDTTGHFHSNRIEEVKILNDQFNKIKSEFIRYLKTLNISPSIGTPGHSNYLYEGRIHQREGERLDYRNNQAEFQLILNFNYTSLPERVYQLNNSPDKPKTSIINIHGDLDNHNQNNPIIFGYGDEMDDDYHQLESLEEDEVLRHFKSTQYSKTHNYHRLLSFIEMGPFQIDIVGHGCGMTDRVLLNTIFEHDNCDRIKIFHYKNINHYTETYMHVSRHFNKDKKHLLRQRVLPFDPKTPCPQWDDK